MREHGTVGKEVGRAYIVADTYERHGRVAHTDVWVLLMLANCTYVLKRKHMICLCGGTVIPERVGCPNGCGATARRWFSKSFACPAD